MPTPAPRSKKWQPLNQIITAIQQQVQKGNEAVLENATTPKLAVAECRIDLSAYLTVDPESSEVMALLPEPDEVRGILQRVAAIGALGGGPGTPGADLLREVELLVQDGQAKIARLSVSFKVTHPALHRATTPGTPGTPQAATPPAAP